MPSFGFRLSKSHNTEEQRLLSTSACVKLEFGTNSITTFFCSKHNSIGVDLAKTVNENEERHTIHESILGSFTIKHENWAETKSV